VLDSPERRWGGSVRAWPVLQGILPIEGSRVPAEALAGLTLAAVGIPEVLGYAKIAGMPLVTGLYTMLIPRIPRPRSYSPPRSPASRRPARSGTSGWPD